MERQPETTIATWDQNNAPPPINGVLTGTIITVGNSGEVWVNHRANPAQEAIVAQSIVPIDPKDVGRRVVLMFEEGDPIRPIIIGFLQRSNSTIATLLDGMLSRAETPPDIKIDGESLTVTAKKEIVIQCGKASITLTRAGKVLIRGAYLLSRSSGVNRIKGGSIQIN